MTRRDNISRLHHILDAAGNAVEFTRDKQRCDLDTNKMLGFAVIHLLEIIGEATRGISEEMQLKYPRVPWQQMASMRNNLIHGYFQVDNDLVWETVRTELPPLITQIKSILRKESKNADA
jgi:uncharacterized protein with HEPN domain